MAGEASEEVKEELEKKKQEKIDEKKTVKEKTTVDKESKGSKYIPKEEKDEKEIKKSDGIIDSLSSIFEAVSGTGRFEGDDSSLFSRLGKAFSKADNITQMLSGAGITMALMKLIDNTKEDDDDDAAEEFSDEIKKNKRSLDEKLDKSYQESSALAARITSAMQNQNIANNLAGSGVMIKSLAMISIKTQDSLKSISEFLYKTSLAQSECLSNLSDSIEDISDSDGDLLQGMMPLFIGGLMVAFGSFFLGDKGKKGVIDNLIDRVVNSMINIILGSDANENTNILGTFVDKILEIFEVNKDSITKSIKNITNLLSNDFWEKLSNSIEKIDTREIDSFINKFLSIDFVDLQQSFSNFTKFLTDNSSAIKNISNILGRFFSQEAAAEEGGEKTSYDSFSTTVKNILKNLQSKGREASLSHILSILDKISRFTEVLTNDEKREELINNVINDVKRALESTIKSLTSIIIDEFKKVKEEIGNLDKFLIWSGLKDDNELQEDIGKILKKRLKSLSEEDESSNARSTINKIVPLTTALRAPQPRFSRDENLNKDNSINNALNEIKENISAQKESINNLSENIGKLATGIINMPPPVITSPEVNINKDDIIKPIKDSLSKISEEISDINQKLKTSF